MEVSSRSGADISLMADAQEHCWKWILTLSLLGHSGTRHQRSSNSRRLQEKKRQSAVSRLRDPVLILSVLRQPSLTAATITVRVSFG